jgi:hypothetical protein
MSRKFAKSAFIWFTIFVASSLRWLCSASPLELSVKEKLKWQIVTVVYLQASIVIVLQRLGSCRKDICREACRPSPKVGDIFSAHCCHCCTIYCRDVIFKFGGDSRIPKLKWRGKNRCDFGSSVSFGDADAHLPHEVSPKLTCIELFNVLLSASAPHQSHSWEEDIPFVLELRLFSDFLHSLHIKDTVENLVRSYNSLPYCPLG